MSQTSIYHENKLMIGLCLLGVIYLALSLHCYRRLMFLQRHSFELNTRKLFVMSCFLSCVLRVMSFASLVILNFGYINIDDTVDLENEDSFLGAAMLVLIDFPNYVIISAYMLVAVVWAEAFLQSRRHWMSHFDYKRKWLMGYLIFNTCLYSVQLCLYSIIFLPNINVSMMSSLLYGAMTVINIFLPSIWFALYIVMSMKFAGFPPSSKVAIDRLYILTKLGSVWTVTRLAWGAISLTEVTDKWLFGNRTSPLLLSVELLLVFFIVEIIPIWLSLHMEYLQALVPQDSDESRHETPSMRNNVTDSGNFYRNYDKGYSFDGEDDLHNIPFSNSYDQLYNISNDTTSLVSTAGSDSSGVYTARGSSCLQRDTRSTLGSRGVSYTSAASLAESDESDNEHAPSAQSSGYWFLNWW